MDVVAAGVHHRRHVVVSAFGHHRAGSGQPGLLFDRQRVYVDARDDGRPVAVTQPRPLHGRYPLVTCRPSLRKVLGSQTGPAA